MDSKTYITKSHVRPETAYTLIGLSPDIEEVENIEDTEEIEGAEEEDKEL